MTHSPSLLVYPVTDITAAKTIYGKLLGTDPYVDAPYYVGFRLGDFELGLDPNGRARGITAPLAYWPVADIRRSLQELLEAGAQLQQDVQDVGGGKLTASVKDADGNVTGLIQSA